MSDWVQKDIQLARQLIARMHKPAKKATADDRMPSRRYPQLAIKKDSAADLHDALVDALGILTENGFMKLGSPRLAYIRQTICAASGVKTWELPEPD